MKYSFAPQHTSLKVTRPVLCFDVQTSNSMNYGLKSSLVISRIRLRDIEWRPTCRSRGKSWGCDMTPDDIDIKELWRINSDGYNVVMNAHNRIIYIITTKTAANTTKTTATSNSIRRQKRSGIRTPSRRAQRFRVGNGVSCRRSSRSSNISSSRDSMSSSKRNQRKLQRYTPERQQRLFHK